MAAKLKMVGLVRFSVLTPTYFSQQFPTLADAASHLFAPDRLALRLSVFEKLCLHSLVRQSDPGFEAVILTAAALPEPFMAQLKDLLAPYPHLHLRPVGGRNHYRLLQKGYESAGAGGCSHRILFRLDDDDGLDLDYVRRIKRLAQAILPLQAPEAPFVLSGNRGFYLRATPDGPEVFDAVEQAPLSAGTALVAPAGSKENPYKFNHRKLACHYNLYSDVSVPSFIRTIHGDNKSDPTPKGISHRMTGSETDSALRRHFGLSLDDLKAI